MEIYEKNWDIIQTKRPYLVDIIQEHELDETITLESIETREDKTALQVTKEGETIRLNSAYRPLQEAKRWASQYDFRNLKIVTFMFGFGNGLFVREILSQLPADGKVLVGEPCVEIFQYILENEDISDILEDERFFFFLGENGSKLLKDVGRGFVEWSNMATQIRCEHPGYKKLFEDSYAEYWNAVARINVMSQTAMQTNAHFAHKAVRNVMNNLKHIRHSNYVTEYVGSVPSDVPAIIVSAGPSLEKNIEDLKAAVGKAIIIATDTAVRVLENHQIPYDCMITVDPAKPAKYLVEYPGCKDVPLFLSAEVQSDITEFHTGRKIWMPGSIYLDGVYANNGLFFPPYSVGGSVATSAYTLSGLLGCKCIILIGQDLAYEGSKTHAGGIEDHIRDEEKTITTIPGIHGDMVKTRRDWVYYLRWFEESIERNEDLTVVDATEGGALIRGTEILTLAEAIDTYCKTEFSFRGLLEESPETFQMQEFEPVYEDIMKLEKGLNNILSRVKKTISSTEEFITNNAGLSDKKHDRLIKEIKKANNFIGKQFGNEIVEMYSSDLNVTELQGVNVITGDVATDELNSVKGIHEVYKSYILACEAVLEMFGAVKEFI